MSLKTCIENQKLLGIRAMCNETTNYKIYLDDMPGIDQKRMANIASNSTGMELMQKAIRMGWEDTLEEALNYRKNEGSVPILSFNPAKGIYSQREFQTRVMPVFAGERGLNVEFKYPYKYQYSILVIDNVHLRTVADATGILLKVVNGAKTYYIDKNSETYIETSATNAKNLNTNADILIADIPTVDTKANDTLTIPQVNLELVNDFSVVFDQTTIETYQAFVPQMKACCGNAPKPLLQNGLRITDSFGVSLDISQRCDSELMKCNMMVYLFFAARYRAVIHLIQEALLSDRMNFFTMNSKEGLAAYGENMANMYRQKLNETVPTLRKLLSANDNNCFSCNGFTKMPIAF